MNNIDLAEILFETLIKRFKKYTNQNKRPPFYCIAFEKGTINLRSFIAEIISYPNDEPRLQRMIKLSDWLIDEWNNSLNFLKSDKSEENPPECFTVDADGQVWFREISKKNNIEKWIERNNPEPFFWDNLMYFVNEVNGYLKEKTKHVLPPQPEPDFVGFDCPLSKETVSEVWEIMRAKKQITAEKSDFLKMFNKEPGRPEKPIIWRLKVKREPKPYKPNKTALYIFLKLMLKIEPFPVELLRKANVLFTPNNIFPKNYSYPNDNNDKRAAISNHFLEVNEVINPSFKIRNSRVLPSTL